MLCQHYNNLLALASTMKAWYTMNYTYSILRDYQPDTGFTIWLLIKFNRDRPTGSNKVRQQVADIFYTVMGRASVAERPFAERKATRFWVAGPVSESETGLLREKGAAQ